MERLFFALTLSAKQKLELEYWRDKNFPNWPKAVPAANFHITLAFLGLQDTQLQQKLLEDARDIKSVSFELIMNEPGFFSKPSILWLGPTQIPAELLQLVEKLNLLARKHSITILHQVYRPHITLIRGMKTPPPAPIIPIELKLKCDSFSLFCSRSTAQGVRYLELDSWPLNSLTLDNREL